MDKPTNFIPAEAPTQILNDHTRCMDERNLLETLELIEKFGAKDIESYQAPGGDGFYPVLSDVVQEATAAGSVDHGVDKSFRAVFGKLEDSSHRTAVHNDNHGKEGIEAKYGGCGFLAKLREILEYAGNNAEGIIQRLTVTEDQADRIRKFAAAAGRLANPEYVNKTGAELVQMAVNELGSHLWTVVDEHDAEGAVINNGEGTIAVKKTRAFNVDVQPVAKVAETKLGFDPQDAEAVLKLLTVAAVDVLKPGTELEERE